MEWLIDLHLFLGILVLFLYGLKSYQIFLQIFCLRIVTNRVFTSINLGGPDGALSVVRLLFPTCGLLIVERIRILS